jgi:hypothetical protein
MAWIEFHDTVAEHYKTKDLARIMGWELNTAVGALSRFWLWCTKFADDGDLRKHHDQRIADSVGLGSDDAKKFVDAMVEAGWIDRKPCFRVHDWWDYAKAFLRSRYKDAPEKWQRIKALYDERAPELHRSNTRVTPSTNRHTNQTKPTNLTVVAADAAPLTPQAEFVSSFKATYEAKTGKTYDVQRADYVIAADLIKSHTFRVCAEKAGILGVLCERRSAWFTKDSGWASFTIKTLKQHWNAVILESDKPTKDDELKTEMEKWRRT